MSQIDVERFLGRMITDESFRSRVAESPEAAAREAGINLSREELAFLVCLDQAQFQRVAGGVDDSIKRR